jgi:DNA-binding LacI/PurR family transcriptional regulator
MAVTLRDIARHLGISHATVSFVLNNRTDMGITEATRQRVLVAARELGYKPNRAARALTTGRTQMLAICIPSSGDGYYSAIFHGLRLAMQKSDYEIVVWETETDGQGSKKPSDLNVDGFIALELRETEEAFTDDDGIRKPGVNIGFVPRPEWDNVVVDVSAATEQAFKHLIDIGCTNIAYLGTKDSTDQVDDRARAFRNLSAVPGIVKREIVCAKRDRQAAMDSVREAVEESGRPDGVLSCCDGLAIAAKRALSEMGCHCPKDVAIIGCGGIQEAEYSTPALSTISHPIQQICNDAWDLLRQRLEDKSAPLQTRHHKAEFIPRESSRGFGKGVRA